MASFYNCTGTPGRAPAAAAPAIDGPSKKNREKALKEMRALINLRIDTCDQVVRIEKAFTGLKDLFPENVDHIDFENGYRLLDVTVGPNENNPARITAEAEFSPGSKALFSLSHTPMSQLCEVDLMFRAKLPKWVKIGNKAAHLSEKGVPTAKALTTLLAKKLGLTKDNVRSILTLSINPQTVVDVIHGTLVKKMSIPEAFAQAHTSQLNAELMNTLSGQELHLHDIFCMPPRYCANLEGLIYGTDWEEPEMEAFRNQLKIKEIHDLTGIDIREVSIEIPGMISLTYSVGKAPAFSTRVFKEESLTLCIASFVKDKAALRCVAKSFKTL